MTEPLPASTHTTPGPWEWTGQGFSARGRDVLVLADDGGCDDPECCGGASYYISVSDEDAQLIAAAPELLAALKNVACPQCEVIFAKHPEYYEVHPCEQCAPWRRLIATVEGQ